MVFSYYSGIFLFVNIASLSSVSAIDIAGKIATNPACKDDVTRLCSSQVLPNDLAVLDCLQNRRSDSDSDIRTECHSFLWQFKLNLTKGDQFLEAAEKMCSEELKSLEECKDQSLEGHKLSCLLENSDSVAQGQCKSFLVRIGSIIFSDFRLVEKFTTACQGDISKFNCGRLDSEEEKDHKQGSTIECLSEHVRNLTKECHLQTLRVAELQADDYHLDRPLFLACRDDRERFCRNAQAGQGRVYKCLIKNKMQNDMSTKCREKLVRRQQLVSEDYKVSKGLVRACKQEIIEHKCFKETNSPVKDRKVKLAQVLLCLENAMHAGNAIGGECQAEMLDHRRQLLEDYRLSPEVVYSCQEDIKTNCRTKEIGGKTLHCLMKHARRQNGISDTCLRALEDLMRITDAGSDWQVDSLLKTSCSSVVETACKNPADSQPASVISCLMDKVFSDVMTTGCRTALLEIQYFVARDFRLDSQLYAQCKSDAAQFCNAAPNWTEEANAIGPQRNPLVLPCLYRYAYHPPADSSLKPECADEVRRVMRQRANSVDLIPEVEEPCIEDLASLCFEKTGRGEEMQCLQDNLERLSPVCKQQVSNYTEEEAEHLELNPFITTYCSRFLETHCQDEMDDGDEGQVMECLVEYKMNTETTMNSKCRAAVEHFQLIALQDFRFSAHFKRACKLDISRLCPNIKAKPQVVACLSEMVRNDSVAQSLGVRSGNHVGSQHRVSQPCRQQLRNQLLQQHEDVQFNPNVRKPCASDEKRFCAQIKPGQGRILECLKAHRKQLDDICHAAIFQAEKEEMDDSGVDFQFIQQCKDPIRRLCQNDASNALECLKGYLDDSTLELHCKELVLERMAEQNLDIRFNPNLKKACSMDIPKFCLGSASKDRELEGKVVDCLKQNFVAKKPLTQSCSDHLTVIMEQQALHYQLDPVLVNLCDKEIQIHCGPEEPENTRQGQVEECLKRKFDTLTSVECRRHVALLITAVQIDIQADPMLHRACAIDLVTFCKDVPPGDGRKPHIGHMYTAVIADSSARFHRLIGNSVTFSTGTDEHGLKIQQAALHANEEPGRFCDHVSGLFKTAFKNCEISYTDYIRTTESRHKENVHSFWEILSEKGYIYKGKYEGWYCTADEAFVAEDQTMLVKLPNGQEQRVSTESNRPVEWFSEENYLFELSKLREKLRHWLKSGPVIRPLRHYNLVKSWLDQELIDLSISRPGARLSWGIPVPGDSSQTIYVWLDALLNYMTVAKHSQSKMNIWPPSVHVIGKDILKFHSIYWPAFLLAAGLEPPKSLLVHGHWLVDDQKMSKTTGNVVSPQSCINLVTATGLRYFLMHEGVPASDGNFSMKRMVRIANSDLADGIGNLVSRCCGKSLNPLQTRLGVSPSSFESCGTPGSDLLSLLERTPDIVHDEYQKWNFYKGIDQVMALVRGANGFFQTMEPWKLKKEGQLDQLNATMAVTLETARVVGTLLQPIVPSYSERLLDKLGVPQENRSWDFARLRWTTTETALGSQQAVLFPRIKFD
ncbi:LOW QUALITY PROTEIN: Golgi apparatus protein 1 [Daphnia magna]|uniref:LOW QUALITY PROTEIN: Golgi apparatus protein 1 n=1 Tax=Daphnia magna TaxID=35525 RepID=UPI001E1BC4E7|nr:LOW QUALITY PROTEIN: Golgi apparatus protein 1 [Daphnia magna]